MVDNGVRSAIRCRGIDKRIGLVLLVYGIRRHGWPHRSSVGRVDGCLRGVDGGGNSSIRLRLLNGHRRRSGDKNRFHLGRPRFDMLNVKVVWVGCGHRKHLSKGWQAAADTTASRVGDSALLIDKGGSCGSGS